MKCSGCGAENPEGLKTCKACGRPLSRQATSPLERGHNLEAGLDGGAVSTKMKLDYLHGMGDPVLRRLDVIQALLAHFRKPQLELDALLQEAAGLIARHMGIDNVSIGLRDPDGLFRYKAMVGFRQDAIEAHKRIAYRKQQFTNESEFKGTDISKQTRLYLAEDNVLTDSEQKAFNRPGLLATKRRNPTESLEGDYLDIKICGPFDELLGWIEISGTRTMQLPDSATIKWIEIVASIVGTAVMYKAAHG